jgi:protein toll
MINNPVACDCSIYSLVSKLPKQKFASESLHIVIGDLKCHEPDDMRGKFVRNLRAENFTCSFDECIENCRCRKRSKENFIAIDCELKVSEDELSQFMNKSVTCYNELKQKHTEYLEDNYATFTASLNLPCYENFELKLRNMSSLPRLSENKFKNILKLLASGNKITEIFMENLPQNLKVLELHDNSLAIVNKTVVEKLKELPLERITLGNNPWICNCNNFEFINFVNETNRTTIVDYEQVRCAEDSRAFSQIMNLETCPEEPSKVFSEDQNAILFFFITPFIIGLLVGCIVALYIKYQKQIKMWLYTNNFCLCIVTEEELDEVFTFLAILRISIENIEIVSGQNVRRFRQLLVP